MGKNKENVFVRFDNRWQNYLDRATKRKIGLYKASPIGYPLFDLFVMLYFLGLIISMIWVVNIIIKPVPFEIEGSCNTGFIGVDYQMDFKNIPYKRELWSRLSAARNITDYDIANLPKHLNLKNIDGLNCNFKIKGAIPANKLQELT